MWVTIYRELRGHFLDVTDRPEEFNKFGIAQGGGHCYSISTLVCTVPSHTQVDRGRKCSNRQPASWDGTLSCVPHKCSIRYETAATALVESLRYNILLPNTVANFRESTSRTPHTPPSALGKLKSFLNAYRRYLIRLFCKRADLRGLCSQISTFLCQMSVGQTSPVRQRFLTERIDCKDYIYFE